MRPIKLIMDSFVSYKHQEIDFEALGSRGIFLITGKTGTGKTTIFHAICYALYGKIASDKTLDTLNSSYTDTKYGEVTLEFEAKGKRYKISRRIPVKKYNADGSVTLYGKKVKLSGDGIAEPITSISDADEKIVQILGIGFDDYSQIAMIAQNKFRELLIADAAKRSAILRTLFKTEKYEALGEKIHNCYNAAAGAVADDSKRLVQELAGFKLSEQSPFADKTESYRAQKTLADPRLVLNTMEEANAFEKESFEKTEKEFEAADKLFNEANSAYESAKELSGRFERCDDVKKSIDTAEKRLAAAEEGVKEAQLKKLRSEQIGALLTHKDEVIAKIAERDTLRDIIKQLESKKDAHVRQTKLFDKQIKDGSDSLERLEKERASLEGIGSALERLNAQKNDLDKQINEAEDCLVILRKLFKLGSDVKAAQHKYLADSAAYEKSSAELSRLSKLYDDNIAGVLARKLEEGKPCPVCGSIHHPERASDSIGDIDKSTIDAIRRRTEELEKTKDESKDNSAKARLAYNQDLGAAQNRFRAITGTELGNEATADSVRPLSDLNEKLKKRRVSCLADIISAKAGSDRYNKLCDEIPRLRTRIDSLKQSAAAERIELEKTDTQLSEKKSSFDKLDKSCEFSSKQEALSHYAALEKEKGVIEQLLSSSEKEKQEALSERDKLSGTLAELEKALEGQQKPDLKALTEQREKLASDKEKLRRRSADIKSITDLNDGRIAEFRKALAALEADERMRDALRTLDETVSGRQGAKDKLNFERFIQRMFLDEVVLKANKRFYKMSDGHFTLKRRTERDSEHSGLNLDVINHWTNDEAIAAETLSGGEAFMASLSLALGLSDCVTDRTGGIELSSMFIDEGFGTLDTDTLRITMKTLDDLARGDKLIGIISHVSELKERIPRRLEVTTERTGGSSVKTIT